MAELPLQEDDGNLLAFAKELADLPRSANGQFRP